MSYTYSAQTGGHCRKGNRTFHIAADACCPGFRRGYTHPGAAGQQIDLPETMRAKMENAFGADLSAVKIYKSQAVEAVGSQAITQGSDIVFAPGLLDFPSFGGQALLSHEISHVVSQARGEVTGGG